MFSYRIHDPALSRVSDQLCIVLTTTTGQAGLVVVVVLL